MLTVLQFNFLKLRHIIFGGGLNLGTRFYSTCPGRFQDRILNYSMPADFHILSNSSFAVNHLVTYTTEKSLLNMPGSN
jgi:hypothetical protein